MERTTSIKEAKEIMGSNFIGHEELALIADNLGIKVPSEIPSIFYDLLELQDKQNDYILILGVSQMKNGDPLSLKTLRNRFGFNPNVSEPCFYNQDWYLKENFVNKTLDFKWFLVRKSVFPESRSKSPDILKLKYNLPSAILCAFTFFANYFHTGGEVLWPNDFIWCSDNDANSDQVYIGRYIDNTGFSKNGFSIHRHLKIRDNYGSLDFY
jgi:hypothetical protein